MQELTYLSLSDKVLIFLYLSDHNLKFINIFSNVEKESILFVGNV